MVAGRAAGLGGVRIGLSGSGVCLCVERFPCVPVSHDSRDRGVRRVPARRPAQIPSERRTTMAQVQPGRLEQIESALTSLSDLRGARLVGLIETYEAALEELRSWNDPALGKLIARLEALLREAIEQRDSSR